MSVGTIFSDWRNSIAHFAAYALTYQIPFCQITPLLSSALKQQNILEYWLEGSTAIGPKSVPGIMNHNRRITFRVAII